MNFPVETKPAVWGFICGAVALAVVGFNWGGWVTGGRAEVDATKRADAAVVSALAPICVDKFQHASGVVANRAAFKKLEQWSQGEFVEKGGWATVPGTNPPGQESAVARACATLLATA